MIPTSFPSQSELFEPLLRCYRNSGGEAPNADIYDALADEFDLPPAARAHRTPTSSDSDQSINTWERHVRWVQQKAKLDAKIERADAGVWRLTANQEHPQNAQGDTTITVFSTSLGTMVWSDASQAAAYLEDGIADLIFTSVPYPLVRRKGYANEHSAKDHLIWVTELIERWLPKLADDGAIALNVGDVYLPGIPAQSGWTERLLVNLLDLGLYKTTTIYWRSPTKLPAPAHWVTVRRERIKDEVEPVYILTKDPERSHLSNDRVLRPYSQSMKQRLAAGGQAAQRRPSGHSSTNGAFSTDNGGSIAGNVLEIPNSRSNTHYLRRCRELGIPAHPARFPAELANWIIRYTTRPLDLMIELCAGSGTACIEAEKLRRRWIGFDIALTYLHGAALRFEHLTDFRSFFPPTITSSFLPPPLTLFPQKP